MKPYSLLNIFAVAGALGIGAAMFPVSLQAQQLTGPSPAEQLKCGAYYKIEVGDSLTSIAQRAYGAASGSQYIYLANSRVIGSNPGHIRVGSVLQIPCLSSLEPSTADGTIIRPAATTAALPAPKRKIRVVTGTDWAPFLDQGQKQGGMITEVTNVALSNAPGKPEYKIDFVNDWSAHLRPLITDHAYDFSIAWFKPNCDLIDRLSDDSKFRCNNLDWSQPMFEQIIGYYTRINQPRPANHQALFGLTICRPNGFSTFMMEENDLIEPNVKLARPNKTTDCFEGLVSGKYDVVVLASDTADGAIAKIGAKNKVQFQEHLAQVATMHAVIAKTHPRGKAFLAELDSGIKKIKESGEWFKIVSRHMAQHRAKTQN